MIRLDAITKSYGPKLALEKTSFAVAKGEFVTLLGPSGSGKTTILNLVAGMARPTSGRIYIGDRDVTDLGASKRDIGMVFQHYALMPHMSVFENIAFPLRVRKQTRKQIEHRVTEMLELIRLPDLGDRRPNELSGGQQQRVAIARCLAYDPQLILMDEPLGALDKKLREEMQVEIKRLHAQTGVTMIYVTHDQDEALTMSDRIILMSNGCIEQMGTPVEMYRRPASVFAATFLGDSNLFPGRVTELSGGKARVETAWGSFVAEASIGITHIGEAATIVVRPEHVRVHTQGENITDFVEARMIEAISYGGTTKCTMQLSGGHPMAMRLLGAADQPVAPDMRLQLTWDRRHAWALPEAQTKAA